MEELCLDSFCIDVKYFCGNSDNVFTFVLPPNADHVMVPLGGYNCSVRADIHALSRM